MNCVYILHSNKSTISYLCNELKSSGNLLVRHRHLVCEKTAHTILFGTFENFLSGTLVIDCKLLQLFILSNLDLTEVLKESLARVIVVDCPADISVQNFSLLLNNNLAGCLIKNESLQSMLGAIHAVNTGLVCLSVSFVDQLGTGRQRECYDNELLRMLTFRERQVLKLVSEGYTNKEVAHALNVKRRTVEFHMSNVFRKLNVNSRTEAALLVQQ